MKIEMIDPTEYPNWDDLVRASPGYTFFHTSCWAKVLCETYRYQPLYFVLRKENAFSALLPIIEVKSIFTGKRGVSLPFTDYCNPIFEDYHSFESVLLGAMEYGKSAGWKYLETRSVEVNGLPESQDEYFIHAIKLCRGSDEVYNALHGSLRRNIRRALKERVDINICNEKKSIDLFYCLNCMTRRRHHIPPQPFSFFLNVYRYIISHNKGDIFFAAHDGNVIAAAIFFHFGEYAIYKYGASDERYLSLRPNHLLMWRAIEHYSRSGIKILSLGRTSASDEGLLRFKNGWNTDIKRMIYRRVNFMYQKKGRHKSGNLNHLFKILPYPLQRAAGKILYRHFG